MLGLLTTFALWSQASGKPISPWVKDETTSKWTKNGNRWIVGANFIPSSAVNELQMWQVQDYDHATIERELGYAKGLGFNTMRVFLHNLLYDPSNPNVLFNSIDGFLNTTASMDMGIMLVLLDSCWNADPALGTQPDPIPGVHNSQWVQAPGQALVTGPFEDFQAEVEPYVTAVVSRFKDDARVVAWDLWNEPDNSGYTSAQITPLLSSVFDWVSAVAPSQPTTTPLWQGHNHWSKFDTLTPLQQLQITRSDVISFHHYDQVELLQRAVEQLQVYGKPIVCTEYMAREAGSYFNPNMGYLQSVGVAAYNWGLVSGLTQTIYPWDSAVKPYDSEPDPWFHDIITIDGACKYPDECFYIRNITGVASVV
jgi:hypothetical protein